MWSSSATTLLGSEGPLVASALRGGARPTTRALELRKGSADAAMNALTADTVLALERDLTCELSALQGRSSPISVSTCATRCSATCASGKRLRAPLIALRFCNISGAGSRSPLRASCRSRAGRTLPTATDLFTILKEPGRSSTRLAIPCERHALSCHHEDFDRGEHTTAGGGFAAAIARRGNCPRYPHLRVRHVSGRCHPRRFPVLFVTAGLAEMKILIFLTRFSIAAVSLRQEGPRVLFEPARR